MNKMEYTICLVISSILVGIAYPKKLDWQTIGLKDLLCLLALDRSIAILFLTVGKSMSSR